jgi:protein-arginine kinase activator protein McsA
MYLFVYVLYIKFHKSSMCICFNCMQFEQFMWHSSVGCWVCYSMFHREKKRILQSSMPQNGWSGMLHLELVRKVINRGNGVLVPDYNFV